MNLFLRPSFPGSVPLWRHLYKTKGRQVYHAQLSLSRNFSSSSPFFTITKPSMEVELTAPNGKKWTQPLGLFINNEFVKSSNEQKLASINPTYVLELLSHYSPMYTNLTNKCPQYGRRNLLGLRGNRRGCRRRRISSPQGLQARIMEVSIRN